MCSRPDGRDLRAEFQAAGYTYVWNSAEFAQLTAANLPVLGLFESSHMEYEFDRLNDLGGEPSLQEMTTKAIEFLQAAVDADANSNCYFLMVESGRIDHAHHESNAFRSLTDTEELDQTVGAAANQVGDDTLIVVTADHSHVFTIAGYPMRPPADIPYTFGNAPAGYLDNDASFSGILDVVYDIDRTTGDITETLDSGNIPYTILGYTNGPGFRGLQLGADCSILGVGTLQRVDPRTDTFPGRSASGCLPMTGPEDTEYVQEAAVPLSAETHSAEEVAIYAAGPNADRFKGTVKNSFIASVMRDTLGLASTSAAK